MESFLFFCKGVLIGFVASIPLGPVGVICIQRTLCKSFRSGFISGLGAAGADTIFALLASFFLNVVLAFITRHIEIIKVIGGMCVIVVGASIFFKNVVLQIRRNRANKASLWSDFLSVFFITMTNPALILMFMALFATFGISTDGMKRLDSGWLLLGVMAGTALWWFILTFLISLFRNKFRPRHLLYINKISGAFIAVLGSAVILSIFFNLSAGNLIR